MPQLSRQERLESRLVAIESLAHKGAQLASHMREPEKREYLENIIGRMAEDMIEISAIMMETENPVPAEVDGAAVVKYSGERKGGDAT